MGLEHTGGGQAGFLGGFSSFSLRALSADKDNLFSTFVNTRMRIFLINLKQIA
jgi:hypothetical protein